MTDFKTIRMLGAASATVSLVVLPACETLEPDGGATSSAPVLESADGQDASPPPSNPSKTTGVTRPSEQAAAASADGGAYLSELELCPRMTVSNAPLAEDGVVVDYSGLVQATDEVQIAIAPVEDACLSSAFGPRNGRQHKGIDLHSKEPVDIFAGGDGVVVEAVYRDDYGNMIVIDHGDGVYTRYAHLAEFDGDVKVGENVSLGDRLGVMGNTASYTIPRHLHYEILRGEYDTPKKSFGLMPVDIFQLDSAD